MSKSLKVRKMGDVLLDHENVLMEMAHDHGLQMGEILALTHQWVLIHYPSAVEEYEDGSSPVFFYGTKTSKEE
jgi:hypothetical protein